MEGKKKKREIKIYRSGLRLPPSNHIMTLRLTEHLSSTQDLSIFETKLIQVYLQKRWEDSLWFFALDHALLLTGLLLLFVHSAYVRSPFLIAPVLLIQLWNFAIESIEIRNKGCRAYFSDFWNYFDVLRFAFAFTYFGAAMAASSESAKTVLLTLLSFFQSVKAFHIFSLFKSTRVLLRIVIEIIKDMIPFMLFVLATTLTVSLLFASATPEPALSAATFTGFLMHVYRLDFGDFDLNGYSALDIAIFILAVLIVPLVLLNMLIAIMGDTFDRVKEEQGRRDFQEMAGIIYRYETIARTLCKWKKRVAVWKYIFVSEDVKYSGEETIDLWQGRIRGIKIEIEKVLKKLQSQEEWQREQEEKKKQEEWKQKQEEKQLKSEELLSRILEDFRAVIVS